MKHKFSEHRCAQERGVNKWLGAKEELLLLLLLLFHGQMLLFLLILWSPRVFDVVHCNLMRGAVFSK